MLLLTSILLSLLCFTHSASVLPIGSSLSTISVKNSGKDYSYTIQENHGGKAIEPLHSPHDTPSKLIPSPSSDNNLIQSHKNPHIIPHHQPILHHQIPEYDQHLIPHLPPPQSIAHQHLPPTPVQIPHLLPSHSIAHQHLPAAPVHQNLVPHLPPVHQHPPQETPVNHQSLIPHLPSSLPQEEHQQDAQQKPSAHHEDDSHQIKPIPHGSPPVGDLVYHLPVAPIISAVHLGGGYLSPGDSPYGVPAPPQAVNNYPYNLIRGVI